MELSYSTVRHTVLFEPARQPMIAEAVLQTIAYADVFDYPLTPAEIHRYLIGIKISPAEVEAFLQGSTLFNRSGGYFTLPGREKLAGIRRQRERTAALLWPRAVRYGRVIASLPFVRMVAITGALAMNNVDQGADADFLIVTEPGRLWFCRALVLLIGRLAALQGITLCPNYLVSLHTLNFPDQTLYAAHEIAQMVPLSGLDVFARILEHNTWVADFLPNAFTAPVPIAPPYHSTPASTARRAAEAILRTAPFTSLEHWEMDRKIRKLRFEQANSPESDFSADYCKGHSQRHQAHTMAALNERMNRLQNEVSL